MPFNVEIKALIRNASQCQSLPINLPQYLSTWGNNHWGFAYPTKLGIIGKKNACYTTSNNYMVNMTVVLSFGTSYIIYVSLPPNLRGIFDSSQKHGLVLWTGLPGSMPNADQNSGIDSTSALPMGVPPWLSCIQSDIRPRPLDLLVHLHVLGKLQL